jgi:hypothetical protein
MRNYVLSYLANKGTALEAFVSTGAQPRRRSCQRLAAADNAPRPVQL